MTGASSAGAPTKSCSPFARPTGRSARASSRRRNSPMLRKSTASTQNLGRYLNRYSLQITLALLAAVGGTILSVLGPNLLEKLTKAITDSISSSGVAIDFETVNRVGVLLVIFYCASFVLTAIQGVIMNLVSASLGQRLRRDISEKIDRMPLRYFDAHPRSVFFYFKFITVCRNLYTFSYNPTVTCR